MKNRIVELFASKTRNILSVFYTAGFPNEDSTVSIALYLQEAGVDLIEIGIPFSDPVADGPVIQESNKIALDKGMTLSKLLKQVVEIRRKVTLPIILMGYVNPVLQYGMEKFCKDAAEAGVDGVILPDLPLEEFVNEYKSVFESHDLKAIFLISPTTSEERIRKIDNESQGFIYAVSASSTTGAKGDFTEEQEAYFKKLRDKKLNNPFLIGFGISSHKTFEKVNQSAAGAIIGSAFITLLKSSTDLQHDIQQFIKGIRQGN